MTKHQWSQLNAITTTQCKSLVINTGDTAKSNLNVMRDRFYNRSCAKNCQNDALKRNAVKICKKDQHQNVSMIALSDALPYR